MIDLFHNLKEEEANILVEAIPYITVLIAGADGKIDKDEMDWGAKLTKIRSYAHPDVLHDFYKAVGENYQEKVEQLIEQLPPDTAARTTAISQHLEKINDILPKLNPWDAYTLYKSFTSFAKHVAKASGGFLGFGSINKNEADLMGLPMLNPVKKPQEDENDENC